MALVYGEEIILRCNKWEYTFSHEEHCQSSDDKRDINNKKKNTSQGRRLISSLGEGLKIISDAFANYF